MDDDGVERAERLLKKRSYRVPELALLLEMDEYEIEQAVHLGWLNASVVGREIIGIHRDDVLDWLRSRR